MNNSKKCAFNQKYVNKFKFQDYIEPKIKDMAIILFYFNPVNSVNIKNNLLFVKKTFDNSKIPYYIGEIAFFEDKFLFESGIDNIIQFRSDSLMFYKENLINIIEEKIDPKYKKILILDGDILFDNVIWYDVISNVLNTKTICQPFSIANYLDYTNNIIDNRRSNCIVDKNGHPGFAWAFDREWFNKNKLFDLSVVGGGDSALSILLNLKNEYEGLYLFNSNIMKYKNKTEYVRCNKITCCNINIYHLYHGNRLNRQYVSRTKIIENAFKKYNINNIEDMVYRNEIGLLQWKEKYKEDLNLSMLEYFKNRNCDEYLNELTRNMS